LVKIKDIGDELIKYVLHLNSKYRADEGTTRVDTRHMGLGETRKNLKGFVLMGL
jgi:hypothetical protein